MLLGLTMAKVAARGQVTAIASVGQSDALVWCPSPGFFGRASPLCLEFAR